MIILVFSAKYMSFINRLFSFRKYSIIHPNGWYRICCSLAQWQSSEIRSRHRFECQLCHLLTRQLWDNYWSMLRLLRLQNAKTNNKPLKWKNALNGHPGKAAAVTTDIVIISLFGRAGYIWWSKLQLPRCLLEPGPNVACINCIFPSTECFSWWSITRKIKTRNQIVAPKHLLTYFCKYYSELSFVSDYVVTFRLLFFAKTP